MHRSCLNLEKTMNKDWFTQMPLKIQPSDSYIGVSVTSVAEG